MKQTTILVLFFVFLLVATAVLTYDTFVPYVVESAPQKRYETPAYRAVVEIVGSASNSDGSDFKLSLSTYSTGISQESAVLLTNALGSIGQEEYLQRGFILSRTASRQVVNMHVPLVAALPEAGDAALLKIYNDGCAQLSFQGGLPIDRADRKYTVCNSICSCALTETRSSKLSMNPVGRAFSSMLDNLFGSPISFP
ncbi:MAG: hypothetical protein UV83_C0011G0006 [candidate division WWE3 bacterium GW2011_GWE2_43_18]|uniref:Uncharacterized protein n=1 Tax=candidate division WWE3 bacterium TaxID=2053526 RepID=A0A656PND1_UNCKA|nr:MAG: hypothetical protein UU91_C0012G0006 [candidate division WWE3 bacterium GW2011_GWB1_42_117]KKS54459.1 MAG: hypothetical protein UV21_C0008G0012 [candidate division WWE3 bacterium GW2011_GWD2_42_34]KKT04633.1 MAG: hypothetical protein UV83_C0011G0006 [candidate division WWE3 bacterium GW2011_GWE2_43_18]KKT06228.1 MAG: hypothetical protein UV84_C0011G0014 [candidate division WWE3 bacterium GW2011_GWF2_43_18]KKT08056.1 MAG: hypothetical protein UV87_C0008G0006 [candidate division WWE3 bact